MEINKRFSEHEILARVRAAFRPLSCEPLWSRDHDRLGFIIRDDKARRGVRFAPVKLDVLEQENKLIEILDSLKNELRKKGVVAGRPSCN